MNDANVAFGAKFIEQLHSSQIPSCIKLVDAWIAKGVNLALTGPFTQHCSKTM